MECNKDEAAKVKEIAERKLLERDITAAKKFASKAQTMFPKLEGLSQLLEIINVYASHEKKINGEPDYYGIFGVNPLADEDVLKKQYKRMALSLHPDKNKSVGADGAFKIMSEAWGVLSDKEKRHAYNLKLNIRSSNQNQTSGSFRPSSAMYKAAATNPQSVRPARPRTATCQQYTTAGAATPQHVPGHHHTQAAPTVTGAWFVPRPYFIPTPHIPKTTSSATAAQYIPTAHRPPLHPQRTSFTHQPTSRPETFWTLCIKCSTQFEFHRIFLNQNLQCPNCKQPFLATEKPPPNFKNRSPSVSTSVPLSAAKITSRHLKRRHEEAVNMARKNNTTVPEKVEAAASASKEAVTGINVNKDKHKPVKRRRMSGQKYADGKINTEFKRNFEAPSMKELSQIEIRDMLIEKAKREIRLRLSNFLTKKSKSSHTEKVDMKDYQHASKNDSVNQSKDETFSDTKNTLQPQPEDIDDTDANPDEIVSMVVPDANFHNFDNDRIEASFTENQVWAAYDDEDGMPRYYALVQRVISTNPFKIQISWLNSKSSSEFGSLNWIGSGFTKTSGEYRVGKSVVNKRLNSFSHPVKWRKGARGAIQILPSKGDVWALYRNWSSDWNEVTANEVIHVYDMVVVLQDYDEDIGVLVAPLVKVAGFTSVFNQSLRIREIPKEEMFRFSHQVPSYVLNGLEGENVPKGCYELDPAALPLELLKVTIDAEAVEERGSVEEDSRYAFKYSRRTKRNKRKEDGK